MSEKTKATATLIHTEVQKRDKKFPYGAALEIAHKIEGVQSSNHKAAQSNSQAHLGQPDQTWIRVTQWDNSGVDVAFYATEDEAKKATCEDLDIDHSMTPQGRLIVDEEQYLSAVSRAQQSGQLQHHEITQPPTPQAPLGRKIAARSEIETIEHPNNGPLIRNAYLGPIDMEIIGLERTIKGQPNSIIEWAASGMPGLGKGFANIRADLGTEGEVFECRTSDISLRMTREKLERFLRHNLSPLDYLTLAQTFGVFYEIHEDFYYPETGEALQPI